MCPGSIPDALFCPQGWQAESLLRHCTWMLPHWSDWLYQAPALVVLAVNSVFLIVIMWVSVAAAVARACRVTAREPTDDDRDVGSNTASGKRSIFTPALTASSLREFSLFRRGA